ncbi:unnamed protein product [Phytophthora lilii]|uniref:Unnamed protein product n=1 Tax=Phytophthora lilii TaxID=2077276 RepID=A0A9W6XDC2_9STRA|nr:unnamed protein product [Phytophthora lilii]
MGLSMISLTLTYRLITKLIRSIASTAASIWRRTYTKTFNLVSSMTSLRMFSALSKRLSELTLLSAIILSVKSDESDEIYFYPNLANTNVWDSPVAINSKGDIRKNVISDIRSMELADRLNYPKSGYQLKSIVASKIYIYHRDHALGSSEAIIPKVIKDNKSVINFPKTNNKCVFHCIAYHTQTNEKKDPRRMNGLVKETFKRYCEFKNIPYSLSTYRSFKPLDIYQFDDLEECFKLYINVYTYDVESGKAERIRQSDKAYDEINILSHEKHALYIKDINIFLSKYQWSKCEMVFPSAEKLKNHKKNKCEEVNVEFFPAKPTIYRPNPNTIQSLLLKYSIKGVDHYLDHFIVYDFEAILKPINKHKQNKTTIDNEHIPVSVSICDSITEEEQCFVDNQPRTLLKKMFDYIKSVGAKVFRYNILKYDSLIRKIIEAHGLTGMDIPGASLGKTYKINDINQWIEEGKYSSFFDFCDQVSGTRKTDYGKLMQLLKQVPVLGYNLIKNDLFSILGTDNIVSVIKNPSYMCIATNDMKMLNISNYVPAGISYSKYLSTYLGGCQRDDKIRCVCGLGKGIFCYEYITDFSVLNRTQIPPKSAFDSKLRYEDFKRRL